MRLFPSNALLPTYFWTLFALYTVASLTHFVHNAEFIAFYPNMPAWLTRETVYMAWLGIAFEVLTGLALLLAASLWVGRRVLQRDPYPAG